MDWATAVEHHRQSLLAIVATLYAMIGLTGDGRIERLPWPLYRTVLAVLRPAESAVRRLIVVMARGLKVKPYVRRPAKAGLAIAGKRQGRLAFQLFDPRPPQDGGTGHRGLRPQSVPHISVLGFDPRIPLFRRSAPTVPASQPRPHRDDTVSATHLCGRLAAIKSALSDLPRQARRYARWQAKPFAERHPKRYAVLRPCPPPYLRRTSSHEVHTILTECHWLARTVPAGDTS